MKNYVEVSNHKIHHINIEKGTNTDAITVTLKLGNGILFQLYLSLLQGK